MLSSTSAFLCPNLPTEGAYTGSTLGSIRQIPSSRICLRRNSSPKSPIFPVALLFDANFSTIGSRKKHRFPLMFSGNVRYVITLDFGRELFTWMPPNWGISGRRVVVPIVVNFSQGSESTDKDVDRGGICSFLKAGGFLNMNIQEGTWSYKGEPTNTLRFNLKVDGFERGDITIPKGVLYFATPCFGNVVAKSKGIMSIKQKRFFVRTEYRMVGSFTCEKVEEGQDIGPLSSLRVIQPNQIQSKSPW